MDENVKPWKCPQGHVMGLVARDGRGVRRLLLYREAISYQPSAISHEELDVIATIEGYVSDVRCSICGSIRTWVPGEEALKIVLERLEKEAATVYGVPGEFLRLRKENMMEKNEVKLGEKVKDSITGFEGIATGRTVYLNGCVRVLIEPTYLKDGAPIEGVWFDEQRLTDQSDATSGGPTSAPVARKDAPKR